MVGLSGSSGGDETFELVLQPVLGAPGDARRSVAAWCDRVRLPPARLDDLLLVVSELVTNAVVHAATSLRLVIRSDGRRVLTEVFDGDPRRPVVAARSAREVPVGGRGLLLVDQLSERWGCDSVGTGKRVWAVLSAGA
jgi:anti-sigma regulatory factor (Ser/Thr protein kinase)